MKRKERGTKYTSSTHASGSGSKKPSATTSKKQSASGSKKPNGSGSKKKQVGVWVLMF